MLLIGPEFGRGGVSTREVFVSVGLSAMNCNGERGGIYA